MVEIRGFLAESFMKKLLIALFILGFAVIARADGLLLVGTSCTPDTITIGTQPSPLSLTVGGSNGSIGAATDTSGGSCTATSSNTGYMTISGSSTVPVAAGTAHVNWNCTPTGVYCTPAQAQSSAITVSSSAGIAVVTASYQSKSKTANPSVTYASGTAGNHVYIGASDYVSGWTAISTGQFTLTNLTGLSIASQVTSGSHHTVAILQATVSTTGSYTVAWANPSSSPNCLLGTVEASGANGIVDGHNAVENDAGTNAATGSFNANSGELVVGIVGGDNVSYTEPSGWTQVFQETDTSNQPGEMSWYIPGTSGAINPTWTNSSDDWGAAAASFQHN